MIMMAPNVYLGKESLMVNNSTYVNKTNNDLSP